MPVFENKKPVVQRCTHFRDSTLQIRITMHHFAGYELPVRGMTVRAISNNLPAHSLNHTHILHPMWKHAKLRIVAHPTFQSWFQVPTLYRSPPGVFLPVNTLYFSTTHIDHRRNVAPLRDVPRLARGCHSVSLIGEDAELTLVWPSVSRGC